MKALETGWKGFLSGLSFVVLLVLLLLTGASTTFLISDWTEVVFLTHDSSVRNVLYLLLCMAAVYLLRRARHKGRFGTMNARVEYLNKDRGTYQITLAVLLALGAALGLFWAVNNRIIPEQDQLFVFEAAERFHAGDYSDFQPGGYMSMYPNQMGLFLLELFLVTVFRSHCFFALELLNVAAYVLVLWALGALAEQLGATPARSLLTVVAGLCFLPLLFYTSFLYGNLLGLAMGLWAMYFALRFFQGKHWSTLVFSVLLSVSAAAVKNNYLIFLVAIFLQALAEALHQKKVRNVLLALLLVLVYAVQSYGTTAVLERKTEGDLQHGVATLSFVAMGLQVNPVKCDGWYNEFNKESYIESGYDGEKQSALAKRSISDSLNYLKTPSNSLRFFLRKNASQWADPLYQSLWTSQVRGTRNERPGWMNKVLGKTGSTAIGQVLDVLQFWLYAGALLYLVFARKQKGYFASLLLQMTVFGGFLFHCFWEAKGQYTLSYAVLLVPLAVEGFAAFCHWLEGLHRQNLSAPENRHKLEVLVFMLLFVLLVPLTGPLDCLSEGSTAFLTYLNSP